MKRFSLLILLFSVAFAVFFIEPALLGVQFRPFSLMKLGDVLDILTPFVLIALYWLLFCLNDHRPQPLTESMVFLILVVFWVQGQGMHLSANSISHLLQGMENSALYTLTHFYDELLSHYLWHVGIVGLSGLLLFRQWKNPFTGHKAPAWILILAGIIHGFTFFLIVIEAGTALLGIPSAVLVIAFTLLRGREKMSQQPLLTFFFISYAVAALFFAGWAIYWRGLPQFSEVGLI